MATTRKSRMPSDDQMMDDIETARALRDIVTALRKRYPNDSDLMMAERCLDEFKPARSFEPQHRGPVPPRPMMRDKVVEK